MELLKQEAKLAYSKLNAYTKRKFLGELIIEIVDAKWKTFTTDPGKVLTVDYKKDFETKFSDPFSKSLIDVFTRGIERNDKRHTLVRNACFLLSRARRLKSIHAESLSFSVMNSLLSKSTAVRSLFNSETTTVNCLDTYRKMDHPTTDPAEFNILCIDNYQPPFERSYTLSSNKKCNMTVQTVALRFQFDGIERVRGTYSAFKISSENDYSDCKIRRS